MASGIFHSGAEVKFIRLHLGMTLEEFARQFAVTRQAVMKWEKRVNEPTKMEWTTEKDLRLLILARKQIEPKLFLELYKGLRQEVGSASQPIRVCGDLFKDFSLDALLGQILGAAGLPVARV